MAITLRQAVWADLDSKWGEFLNRVEDISILPRTYRALIHFRDLMKCGNQSLLETDSMDLKDAWIKLSSLGRETLGELLSLSDEHDEINTLLARLNWADLLCTSLLQ